MSYDFDQLAASRAAPAAAAQPRTPAHLHDPEYWILAAMFEPMSAPTIARLTGLPVTAVEQRLAAMKVKGLVYSPDGEFWGRVL